MTEETTPSTGATAADEPAWKAHGTSGHVVYEELAASDDFAQLRRRYRAFVLPYTLAFLAWYLLYVLMSNWADGFMDTKIVGHINVALVFGLLQFLSTFVIAWMYSSYAGRQLDPIAGKLQKQFDGRADR